MFGLNVQLLNQTNERSICMLCQTETIWPVIYRVSVSNKTYSIGTRSEFNLTMTPLCVFWESVRLDILNFEPGYETFLYFLCYTARVEINRSCSFINKYLGTYRFLSNNIVIIHGTVQGL